MTISNDLANIEKRAKRNKLSDRRTQELKAEAKLNFHKVVPEKTTTEFALAQWDKEEHKGMYFLTMIVRQLYAVDKTLRDTQFQNHKMEINGRTVGISHLFRNLNGDFGNEDFKNLCAAMAQMHLHHVFAADDTLHKNIVNIIHGAHNNKAQQVRLLNFFFEFSYLAQFETRPAVLKQYAKLDGPALGAVCWAKGIIPISPRFGQGDGAKSWHRQLCKFVEEGKHGKTKFIAKVAEIHERRVFSDAEANLLASICDLPSAGRLSRMPEFNHFFKAMPKFGDFAAKNYSEALLAHGLWPNPTQEEFKLLKDGPGADRYWNQTNIRRADMVKYLHDMIDHFGETTKCISIESCETGKKNGQYRPLQESH